MIEHRLEDLLDLANILAEIRKNSNEYYYRNNLYIIHSIITSGISTATVKYRINRKISSLSHDSRKSNNIKLIYNLIYVYTLEGLIPYLNTEFEPIVYWRYSVGKD